MKTRRPNVSKLSLARSFPANKWFGYEDLRVDISALSFRLRVPAIAGGLVDTRMPGRNSVRFYISQENKSLLIATLLKQVVPRRCPPQKITKRKLTKADKLHNLFEGVRP